MLTGQPLPSGGQLEILETPGRRPCPPREPARPGRWEPANRADRVCPWPMPWRWSTRPPCGFGRPRERDAVATWKAAG